jgi:trigger factor
MKHAERETGREKAVIDFYMNNPSAMYGVRDKILEDKVINFIINSIEIEEVVVTLEEARKLGEM